MHKGPVSWRALLILIITGTAGVFVICCSFGRKSRKICSRFCTINMNCSVCQQKLVPQGHNIAMSIYVLIYILYLRQCNSNNNINNYYQ